MHTRLFSSKTLRTITFAVIAASPLLSSADTAMDAPATTNAVPAAPATPTPPPAPAPAPAPAPIDTTSAPAAAPTERPATYTIATGDSLWTVAHKFGTTVVKLRKLNKLKKHALLHPGQVLQLPPESSDNSTTK